MSKSKVGDIVSVRYVVPYAYSGLEIPRPIDYRPPVGSIGTILATHDDIGELARYRVVFADGKNLGYDPEDLLLVNDNANDKT